jgi:hypothetical protein
LLGRKLGDKESEIGADEATWTRKLLAASQKLSGRAYRIWETNEFNFQKGCASRALTEKMMTDCPEIDMNRCDDEFKWRCMRGCQMVNLLKGKKI